MTSKAASLPRLVCCTSRSSESGASRRRDGRSASRPSGRGREEASIPSLLSARAEIKTTHRVTQHELHTSWNAGRAPWLDACTTRKGAGTTERGRFASAVRLEQLDRVPGRVLEKD